MPVINLIYNLEEHGWATIRAKLDAADLHFRVSYMSDALEDFVSSVVALLSGDAVARFPLIDEPGEYCWVLSRSGATLTVVIVHLERLFTTECYNEKRLPGQAPPEEEGQPVASLECPLAEFAGAVLRMIDDIDARYSPSDFKRTRNHGVPPQLAARFRNLVETFSSGDQLHQRP